MWANRRIPIALFFAPLLIPGLSGRAQDSQTAEGSAPLTVDQFLGILDSLRSPFRSVQLKFETTTSHKNSSKGLRLHGTRIMSRMLVYHVCLASLKKTKPPYSPRIGRRLGV